MERDDILKKAQSQGGELDEREQQMLGISFGFGGVLMALLCVVLAVAELLRGGRAYGYAAIAIAYLAGTYVHQYWKTRRTSTLVLAVIYTLVLAIDLVLFFLE